MHNCLGRPVQVAFEAGHSDQYDHDELVAWRVRPRWIRQLLGTCGAGNHCDGRVLLAEATLLNCAAAFQVTPPSTVSLGGLPGFHAHAGQVVARVSRPGRADLPGMEETALVNPGGEKKDEHDRSKDENERPPA